MLIAVAVLCPQAGQSQEPAQSIGANAASPAMISRLPADTARELAQAESTMREALHNPENLELVEAAIPKAEHVLQVRTAQQGESWWQTIDARDGLADLRRIAAMNAQQRTELAAAERAWEAASQPGADQQMVEALLNAARIEGRLLGENDHWHAQTLYRLGKVYARQFQATQAENAYQQAIAIDRQAIGVQHPAYAEDLISLAELYRSGNRYVQAESLYREALGIQQAALGEDSAAYAKTLDACASLYVSMGRNRLAEEVYLQAQDIEKKTVGEHDPLYATTLCNLGDLYRYMGRYQEAEPLYEQSLAIRKQVLGAEHPDYAMSLDRLAALYESMGRYPQAEPLYRQAIAIRKQALGDQHPDYARSLNNLALLYQEMGRYPESEPLYVQALRIRKQVFGEQNRIYASTLGDLAQLYQATGRYEQAEPLYKQALAIRKKTLGEEHPAYAANLDNLASLYEAMARYDDAEALSLQALAIRKKSVGEQHPGYAHNLVNLAKLNQTMDRYTRAEQLYQQALAIQKKVLGEQNSEYATTLNGLASLYVATARDEQAEGLYRQALDIERRTVGEHHPIYATTLCNLADLYRYMGRYAQAEPLYLQALSIRKQDLGDRHPDYARSLDRLAAIYDSMGRYAEAETLYKQAIAIRKQTLSDEHPDYARSVNNLALLYKEMHRYDESEPLYLEALAIRKKVFGDQHRTYASSLDNLAQLYQAMKKYGQAEPLYKQALAIRKKTLGEQHPAYAVNLDNLAMLYKAMGNYAAAEPLSRQALEIRKKVLGEYHPQYAASLRHLATILVLTGRTQEASQLLLQSAQLQWAHLTENFPTMSDQQKRQFLSRSHFVQSEELSTLVFQGKGVDPKDGLRGVLLGKNLLFEVARQESGALASAILAATPAWRQQWREREHLRNEYASVVLRLMSGESGSTKQGEQKVPDSVRVHVLSEHIDQLDAQLRRSNPAYAATARVQQVKLEDVTRALRPGEALAEYVRYRPFDFAAWKQGPARYGVFVLLGSDGRVAAVDLGDAATIDAAVQDFRGEIREAIDDFKTIQPSRGQVHRSEEKIAETSSSLRRLIWQPMEKELAGVHRVYVAPDGQLSLIPFEALAGKDAAGDWQYLAEGTELIYLGTGRDLSRLASTAAASSAEMQRTAVLIGNPDFNAAPEELAAMEAHTSPRGKVAVAARQPLLPSPSTLGVSGGDDAPRLQIPRNWNQVAVLATLIQQASGQLQRFGWTVTTWMDQQAVKEWVEAINAPRILQFATHGYIMDRASDDPHGWDNPLLRSMLIMAGVNDWQPVYRVDNAFLPEAAARAKGLNDEQLRLARAELSDGVLTAYEVTGMHLQGTELVNMTACETGLGEVTPDGVAGLRQGFLLAGARSLTMSMWEVPAQETTQELGDFYEHWLGSGSQQTQREHRYEAFRAAQLAALARAREQHGSGHPFYWAGTIFFGDPGDLPEPASRVNRHPPETTNSPAKRESKS